ncbi:hypothetical protein N566_20710 [Streptomycetaceae bacterium MP113-05]|nr:hypothetical protein N566_20710 [Streptomycetaceae bacterium MP113-05]
MALAAVGGLTACTGGSGSDEGDTKPGDATAAAESAKPGRFRTLPEPCGAVDRETLKQMLPGAAARAEKAEEKADDDAVGTRTPLDGEAALTYDTDRRVGCNWQSTTSLGSRRLTVDFERVVSYDPEVSDNEQAELVYGERAEDAGVETGEDRPSPGPDTGTGDPTEAADGNGSDGEGGGVETQADASSVTPDDEANAEDGPELGSPSPKPSLPPRRLEDIGDTAFIGDRLEAAADGRGSHRDVTLVFRTSNVLVTVEYGQSIADARHTPDSAELQKYAQNLARQLADQITDG